MLAAVVWLYRECVEQVTQDESGRRETVVTCAPPDLSSGALMLALLLVLLLLWPDVSEISVLGLTLKRRLEVAESRIAASNESVAQMQRVVEFQQEQIDLVGSPRESRSTRLIEDVIGHAVWGPAYSERLQFERQQVARLAPGFEGSQYQPGVAPENSADRKLRLLEEFEKLSRRLGMNVRRSRGRPTNEEADRRDRQSSFIEDHEGAIKSLTALRNAIAHAEEVSDDNVRDGLDLLARLIPLAEDWLGLADEAG